MNINDRMRGVADTVYIILKNDIQARDNDRRLIRLYYEKKYPETLTMSFGHVMSHMDYDSFETITRARRKIQAEYPELSASKHMKKIREEKQMDFIEWARGK